VVTLVLHFPCGLSRDTLQARNSCHFTFIENFTPGPFTHDRSGAPNTQSKFRAVGVRGRSRRHKRLRHNGLQANGK
jgi:hypothetical protein